MQYEALYKLIMDLLEQDLPDWLTYHNADHTRQVIADAEYIAGKENITGDDLILLKTAALMHDTGFLENQEGHEEISCRLAWKFLPDYGYSGDQVEKICRMIMATRLPQSPKDHLSEILCDADLYYLGKGDYADKAEKLFNELKKRGMVSSKEHWHAHQVAFLISHKYITETAKCENEPGKQKVLAGLRSPAARPRQHGARPATLEIIQDAVFMIAGVVTASIALNRFLVPNHFFDGGITGISLLVHEIYHFNLALVIIILNLPLIIISYFSVGRSFAVKAIISVVLLGISLLLIQGEPLTNDKLLISIFGGVFLGIGVGLVMRAGAALDGIEVLALYTLKKTSFTITEIILGINIIIFTIAAMRFGVETALYSILTYFAATRSIDYVVEGLQAFTGVTIISGKSEEIKSALVNRLGRGITVYKGERGFLPGNFEVSTDCDIIFTVITRLELRRLRNLVHEVDPKAFVFANTIKEASGGILKRRHQH